MLVRRRRGRLNQENIAATHVLLDLHVSLAVGKRADCRLTERDSDIFADALGQLAVGRAAENLHLWLKREHGGVRGRAGLTMAMIKTCRKRTPPPLLPTPP